MRSNRSVLIGCLTRHRPNEMRRLLVALAEVSGSGLELHLLVVESEGRDSEIGLTLMQPRLAEGFASVEYVSSPLQGVAPNRNIVLDRVYSGKYEYFAMLDDDTTVHPKWFQWAVEALEAEPSAWCVAGHTRIDVAGVRSDAGAEDIGRLAYETARLPATNNFFARVKPFKEQSLKFDERLPYAGGTDTRFFRAAAGLGAIFLHLPRTTVVEHNLDSDYEFAAVLRRGFGRGRSSGAWLRIDYPFVLTRTSRTVTSIMTATAAGSWRILRGSGNHDRIGEATRLVGYLTGLLVGVITGVASEYERERRRTN